MNLVAASAEVQVERIGTVCSMIHRSIYPTGMALAMTQPQQHQGTFDEGFHDYILEDLIEQPDNSFNGLNMFVAATDGSM